MDGKQMCTQDLCIQCIFKMSLQPSLAQRQPVHLIKDHSICVSMNQIHVALRWTPPVKRQHGRPMNTWRCTITSELNEMGLSRGKARRIPTDRVQWMQTFDSLFPSWDQEDK